MSPNTRQRRQTLTNRIAPSITVANNRIEEAKEAINSPDLFKSTPQNIREAWKELRQAYESTAGKSRDCQPFPLWALDQFEHKHIENVIHLGYFKDIGLLESWAPSAQEYFETEPWKFVFFFNSFEQGRGRVLNKVMKSRPRFAFEQLYKEVRQNCLDRIKGKWDAEIEFKPADFRACCRGNKIISIEDDSDAEYIESSNDEEEDEVTEEDNDSEPGNIVCSPETPGLEREIGYIVGLDAHTSGDQGPEERHSVGDGSSCQDIPHSQTTSRDETEELGETDSTGVTEHRFTVHRFERRDTSPDQPSLHPDDGSTLSIEDQLLQDGPTVLNKLKELKARGEAAEKNIKMFNEKISANKQQLLHVLRNTPSGDFVSEMASLYSDIVIQDGKRKMEEEKKADTDRKKARLVAELVTQFNATSHQFDAQLRTNPQRREAASEYAT